MLQNYIGKFDADITKDLPNMNIQQLLLYSYQRLAESYVSLQEMYIRYSKVGDTKSASIIKSMMETNVSFGTDHLISERDLFGGK